MKTHLVWLFALANVAACGAVERRFALREPLTVDTDLRPVSLPCRSAPSEKDPHHQSCTPEEYVSPLIWDGADNLVFRPFSDLWAFEASDEAANATSTDEVADSSWFTNRIGAHALTTEEMRHGACSNSQLLIDAENTPDGSWLIDKGKTNGSSPGFRVKIPGKGKYLLKSDGDIPERPSAAAVVGAAVYYAAGFNFSCEQVVYVKRSIFKLMPGLTVVDNTERVRPFDQPALDKMLDAAAKKGEYVRFQASAWLPGHLLGPFRYEKTRSDDPNDIIEHQNRRELRGGRILAAWIDHFDAREQNSMDSWISERADEPDSSPGHVAHYYLDTSDCFGSEWDWEPISRRLGYSYIVDWAEIGRDFMTLGIPVRPWDRVQRVKGHEVFGFFDVANFVPDQWKNEYPNPSFRRMTERDGAWMARILAHFTPELVRSLASMSRFTDPGATDYLTFVMQGRLDKILQRYLTRLSPLADAHVEGTNHLCAVDLARYRQLAPPDRFRYDARLPDGTALAATSEDDGRVCLDLPPKTTAATERYVEIRVSDGVATGPLVLHLYDVGSSHGYQLVGVERPER